MPMRSFSLNSDEFHEFVSSPPDPGVWAGGLPQDPRWPREPDAVSVMAGTDAEASEAVKGWLTQMKAGRRG